MSNKVFFVIILFISVCGNINARSNRIKVKANPAAQDLDTTNIDILIREIEYLKAQQIYFNEADSLITETIAAEEVDPNSARFVINDSTIVLPESLEDDYESLLSDWFVKNHMYSDSTCVSSDYIPYCNDSVYMTRLGAIPAVIDMSYNSVVKQYIELYTVRRRSLVEYMLGLGNFYFPIFEEVLNKYDMPHELKYLPVIESALKATARSRVGAQGLWQFMLPTGKIMGLEINSLVDERCDVYKSSDAAARYLKQLYNIYQDWHLAIAAYNCGPGNVNKAIRRSKGKKDYWEIYFNLPKETRGYVPAFIAATYAMTYHCEHNMCPVMTNFTQHTDTIILDKMVHFEQISEFLNVSIDEIRMLNPQYIKDIVPGNVKSSVLRLPAQELYSFIDNQDTIFNHKSEELLVNVRRETTLGGRGVSSTSYSASGNYHKVKSGETLSSIAKKYGTTVNALKSVNGLKSNNLKVGQKLAIGKSGNSSNTASNNTANKNDNYQIYRVKSGDNLWSIANKYNGVTADRIRKLNQLKDNNLKIGQSLKIPII